MEFKVGDTVKVIYSGVKKEIRDFIMENNNSYIITRIDEDGDYILDDDDELHFIKNELELVKENEDEI